MKNVLNSLILSIAFSVALCLLLAGPRQTSAKGVVGGEILPECESPAKTQPKCKDVTGATSECPKTAYYYVCKKGTAGQTNRVHCEFKERRCKSTGCVEVDSFEKKKKKCAENTVPEDP